MWICLLCIVIFSYLTVKWFLRRINLSDLNSRHVLVTGCDTGFGNLLVKHLDMLRMPVFAGCLTEQAQEKLRRECSSNVLTLWLDVTKEESVQKCLNIIKEKLGDKGLWGLVNNAGIAVGAGLIEFTPLAEVHRHVDVNLYGMIRVTKAFLPLVRKSRGRIVNISSMVGRCAMGYVPYTVSKFGVEAFSDILRIELYCTGVSVHILEPGNFKTGIFSAEKTNDYLMSLFKKADKEVQEYYGQQCVDGIAKALTEYEKSSGSPHLWKVVNAYSHALTAKYPKYRYVLGMDAYFVMKILGNLPEWLLDYFMFRNMAIIPAKHNAR